MLRRVGNIAANHPLPPLPPLPTTRQAPPPPPPMVDPLLPPLIYSGTIGFDSPSSDSDFGSNVHTNAHSTPKSTYRPVRTRKVPQTNQNTLPLDRLSVRTELNSCNIDRRKPQSNDDGVKASGLPTTEVPNLFFQKKVNQETDGQTSTCVASTDPTRTGPGIQDQIMASQLRHLSRELTPTISDVYHERNLGLGLAPPLSQLLTARNLQESLREAEDGLLATTISEENSSCSSKTTEGSTKTKPWLSSAALQRFYHTDGGDVLNMDRDSKARSSGSPCSELSRRDEGDGRSIADSQCSAGSAGHRPKSGSLGGGGSCFYSPEKEEPPAPGAPTVPVAVVPMPRMRSSKHHPPPPPPPPVAGASVAATRKANAFPGGFVPQQTPPAPPKC